MVFGAVSARVSAEIKDACPGIHLEHPARVQHYHQIWGPLLQVRTGYATDPEVRRQGSSGGVISALAIHLLESGDVDFVAQIAVSETDPLRNVLQKSRTRADVIRAAGSRYAPSSPLENIREILSSGERFAFIGKPCDVAALRRHLIKYPQYAGQVKYLISFMCAGIPSIHGTYEILAQMGAKKDQVVSFRYRGNGWPGNAKAVQSDGRTFEMDYNTSWGNILGKHLQFRCKLCPDGTGEFADIVCADAWYGKDGYPDFAEREGRSLLLSRTAEGERLVTQAHQANAIGMADLPVDEISKMQPYQVTRKKVVLGRVIAAGFANGSIAKFWSMGLVRASLGINPVTWLRNAWGTYKRASCEEQ